MRTIATLWYNMLVILMACYAGAMNSPKPNAPWTARADLVVKIASPEVAAEKLGRSLEEVMARRQEPGLPDPPRKYPPAGTK